MPASNPADFFKQKRTTAAIKAELGLAIFRIWCDLYGWGDEGENTGEEKTGVFLDLNAGSGLDAEGQALMPLKVLELIHARAVAAAELPERVKVVFSDGNKAALHKLQENLEALDFYSALRQPPVILNESSQPAFLTDWSASATPTCLVADPFAYQWAQALFARAVPPGNSDLVLVFDFAKLQKAVLPAPNDAWRSFWGTRWAGIQEFYQTSGSAVKREKFIIDQFCGVLEDHQYHTLAFKINAPDKRRTSHYLFFASRQTAAYLKVKELLGTYSDLQPDGVPLWGANLRDEAPAIPGFFKFSHPFCLENLVDELAQKKKKYHFLSIREIYEAHSPRTNYVLSNYVTAFTTLRDLGHINILNSANKQVKTVTAAGVVFYKLHRTGTK